MNYNSLRIVKLHREVIESYYTPAEFAQITYADYNQDLHAFIKCIFCSEQAAQNWFIPPLATFHRWIESGDLIALASNVFTIAPSCLRCAQLLNKSNARTLEDQCALIKATLNGTFKLHHER